MTTTLILPLASLKMGRIFRGGKVCIKRCVWNRLAVNLYDLTTFAKEILEEGRSIMRQIDHLRERLRTISSIEMMEPALFNEIERVHSKIMTFHKFTTYFCEVETMDEVKLLKKEWERRRRDDDDSDDGGQGRGLPKIQSAC